MDYFDWEYYINRYEDLRKAGINDKTKAFKHWERFGMKEKRICNKIFENINLYENIDINYYIKNNINITSYIKDKENTIFNHDKKIIAIIPVHGRELLLKYTIRRLYNKNKLYKVICVGETGSEKKVVLSEKGIWVKHDNNPLGKKWNVGFKIAQLYNPDAVLFVGSSDWISSDWIDEAYKYINEYGIIGKRDFTMTDITNKELKICHWLGYPDNSERYNETIGIGRLVSSKLLKKINYLPFDDQLNNGMDWSMYYKCINNNYKVKILNIDSIFLSISCDLWINKHKFLYHYLACNNKMVYLSLDLGNDLNEIYFRTILLDNNKLEKIQIEFPELEEFKNDYNYSLNK